MITDEDRYCEASISTAVVQNPLGLHPRHALLILKTAVEFTSDIQLHSDVPEMTTIADARSVMQIICLGVLQGYPVSVVAVGSDALDASREIKKTIERPSCLEDQPRTPELAVTSPASIST